MLDSDLIDRLHKAASAMSYYNAAESNWHDETTKREEAKVEFRAAAKACEAAGIDTYPLLKGYML